MTGELGASAVELGWAWDETLYAGSAAHYARGRVPYPPEVVTALVDALELDGSGALLDVGCGPGSLTLLLAPHVALATESTRTRTCWPRPPAWPAGSG